MALEKWHGKRAVLSMSGGSLPTDPFAVLQDVSVAPEQNVEELQGAGSTLWQDLMATERAVEITGTVSAWELEVWDELVGFDEVGGGFNTDPDVPTFTTTVTLESSAGSTKEITAEPGYMDPPPELSGDSESWIEMDVNIRAKEITGINNTDAQA